MPKITRPQRSHKSDRKGVSVQGIAPGDYMAAILAQRVSAATTYATQH